MTTMGVRHGVPQRPCAGRRRRTDCYRREVKLSVSARRSLFDFSEIHKIIIWIDHRSPVNHWADAGIHKKAAEFYRVKRSFRAYRGRNRREKGRCSYGSWNSGRPRPHNAAVNVYSLHRLRRAREAATQCRLASAQKMLGKGLNHVLTPSRCAASEAFQEIRASN
jgi:hypothetical protein